MNISHGPLTMAGGPEQRGYGTRPNLGVRKIGNEAPPALLPYDVDFATLPDGTLPAPWQAGASWAIASGKVVNTPVLGAELLSDPGLEGTYTGGVCAGLYLAGGTGTQSADAHGGSKAQGFQATNPGDEIGFQINTPGGPWLWYEAALWSKRAIVQGGGNKFIARGSGTSYSTESGLTQDAYTRYRGVCFGNWVRAGMWNQSAAPFDTTLMDDISLRQIAANSLLAVYEGGTPDVAVKARVRTVNGGPVGVLARVDNLSDPQNYLLACMILVNGSWAMVRLYKVVGGIGTCLIEDFAGSGTDDLIEIRTAGTTVQLFVNGLQKGADQTVDHATLNDNTLHGFLSADPGNSIDRFFLHSRLETPTHTLFMGGSNTEAAGYREPMSNWLREHDEPVITSIAVGGTDSWYAGVRIAQIVAANPTHVIIEYAINDSIYAGLGTRSWWPATEALLLRLRTALPQAKLIFVSLVGADAWQEAQYIAARNAWTALCQKYGVEQHRFDLWLEGVLGHPPNEAEFNTYHWGAHFHPAGYAEIWNMLRTSAPDSYPYQGADWSGNLADYLPYIYADVADWLGAPILRTGVDNDGETGSGWTTNGTARQSSTPNDTIAWTGTLTACALEMPAQTGVLSFQVDGGAWTEIAQTPDSPTVRHLLATTRDSHAVTVKVVSGTITINRFLAT